MALEVKMPVVTELGDDAVVTAWFVDEGQACTAGQLIAEVQAEKVAVEVMASADGFVGNRVAIGDPVPQGSPICEIGDSAPDRTVATAGPDAVSVASAEPPIKASPAARRLAREMGVDLTGIVGSGPDGRITEGDIRSRSDSPGGLSGLRGVIARNMRRSHAETAPVTLFTTVDFGEGAPKSLTARVVKACATALAAHPGLNGTRDGDSFTPAAAANVAVAMQTDEGLVAPVIMDPAGQTVEALVDTIRALAARAATKSLSMADYDGGTFTVTNLGSLGIDGFTPIINLPQVAILGVGTARRVPAFGSDGGVVASYQLVLSLTFDHSFVDGSPAAEFLRDVVGELIGS